MSCGSRVMYSYDAAVKALRSMASADYMKMNLYHCREHKAYHLGHVVRRAESVTGEATDG